MAVIDPEEVIDPKGTLIHNWIRQVTGFDSQHVIQEYQVGKRPKDDYATYFEMGGSENDFSYKKKVDEIDGEPIPDDDVEVTYTTPEIVIYAITIFSLRGKEYLKNLLRSRYLLAARNILKLGNLVIVGKSEVRNLNPFGDTKFRTSYQADFMFRTMDEMKETNQKILEIKLGGEWKDSDMDVSIEIP